MTAGEQITQSDRNVRAKPMLLGARLSVAEKTRDARYYFDVVGFAHGCYTLFMNCPYIFFY